QPRQPALRPARRSSDLRMHEGIDIGVPYGTPIHAAASGTVIYCGWESGYGNLTVIDHGGNLATAYGHQSSIAVSCGQHVDQGQLDRKSTRLHSSHQIIS